MLRPSGQLALSAKPEGLGGGPRGLGGYEGTSLSIVAKLLGAFLVDVRASLDLVGDRSVPWASDALDAFPPLSLWAPTDPSLSALPSQGVPGAEGSSTPGS